MSFLDRYSEILTDTITITSGVATVPDGPGWGAEIDIDALAKYPATDFIQIQDEPYREF